MTEPSEDLIDLENLKARRRRLLRDALDDEVNRVDRLFAYRTQMGASESYVASVSMSWLEQHVQFAHNLPLFRGKTDPETGRIIIDQDTIDLLSQRPIDYSRQFPMTQYLVARKHHKFPPILAVLNRAWVDDPDADEWISGAEGVKRAVRSCAEYEPFVSNGDMGLLSIGADTTLYALDGQHRLLAIIGMMEFIRTGRLEERDQKNGTTGTVLTKEGLQTNYPEITDSYLQSLKAEKIGIEILPTVMRGESREESRQRIRRIFVHVNRMAVSLNKGMMTALDEDNGFRIIAKEVIKNHPLFNITANEGRTLNLVEIEKANLSAASEMLTTLETVANSARKYLEPDERFQHWMPKDPALVPRRPEPEELHAGIDEFKRFLDRLAELPIMHRVRQGESRKLLREFSQEGPRHLLLRPIAQQAIAEAVAYCHFDKGMNLDVLFKKLTKLDREGKFSGIDNEQSYWWGLQVTPGNPGRIKKQRRSSTVWLLIYLMGGFHDEQEKIELLRAQSLKDRTTPPPDEQLYGFDGRQTNPSHFVLPAPVTV